MGSLLRNISLAVVLNLLIKTAWILANNVVQDRVGHADFGIYLALYALGFLFLTLSDLGLTQYATVTLAAKPELLRRLFPNILSLKLALSAAYPVFMFGVGWLLGYRGFELQALFLLCIVHGVLQVNAFFRANFQAFQQFRIDAFASVLDRAFMLAIVGALLFTDITIERYIWAYLASALAAMVILYVAISRIHGRMAPAWSGTANRDLLRASFPFAVITILYSVNDKVDQVMLERIIGGQEGKHETGLYGGAYRWVDTVMMYLWTILPIFFARFAKHRAEPAVLPRLLRTAQLLAALPMILAGTFVQVHSGKLLFLFENSTPHELLVMEGTMRILFLAVLVNGVFAAYSTMLTSTGHERFVSQMIGVSILLNVTLNAVLIPSYGAYACAWATVVSFSFLSLSYIWYIWRKLRFSLPLRELGFYGGCVALAWLTFLGLDKAGLHWAAAVPIVGLLIAVATFAAGFHKLLRGGTEP